MFSSNLVASEQLPYRYIYGMNISVASTTVLAIAPGQCRDAADDNDILVDAPQFLNSAVNGLNGLDVGTLAASTDYAIYEISDASGKLPSGGIISLWSNQYPLLPLGYNSYRLIGFATTDGSSHFIAANILNAQYSKGYFLQPAIGVLSGGNATSFTAIDLSSAIPTTTDRFVIALCTVTFIPAAAGDVVQFRPTGSSATANLATIVGLAAGVAQTQTIALHCGVGSSKPEVDYKVSSSSDSVSVSVNGYYVTLS